MRWATTLAKLSSLEEMVNVPFFCGIDNFHAFFAEVTSASNRVTSLAKVLTLFACVIAKVIKSSATVSQLFTFAALIHKIVVLRVGATARTRPSILYEACVLAYCAVSVRCSTRGTVFVSAIHAHFSIKPLVLGASYT